MTEERTPLQELERRALTGNRFAVVQLVGSLRKYRAAANKLVAQQNKDGFSTQALSAFEDDIENIENDAEEPT
jgi:hypothetical protein